MTMDNKDIVEMKDHRGEESSRNVIDETKIQIRKPTDEVQERGQYLSKKTYDSIKHNKYASYWREIGDDILLQKSPMGNTVMHIAAQYGNDTFVEKITQNASHSHLLHMKNVNDDTALHVAARAGHISTLMKLLAAIVHNLGLRYLEKPKEALNEILAKNKQGNTFFHEALLNGRNDVMKILGSQELRFKVGFLELVKLAALFWINKEEKSVLHLAIEKGYKDIVHDALKILTCQHRALDMLIENHPDLAEMIPERGMEKQQEDSISTDTSRRSSRCSFTVPYSAVDIDIKMRKHSRFKWPLGNQERQELGQDSKTDEEIENKRELAESTPDNPHYGQPGKSLLIVTILKHDQDILQIIVKTMKEWIYSRDNKGMTGLHYAAFIGFLNGVEYLLKKGISCNMVRDNHGFFPLHLASAGGHLEVVKKLLEKCPVPREMLDNYGRNIVHIAAQMGKFNVIKYILQDANDGLVDMINDKDEDGNTPLHLAASHFHPKIVHALTWNKRVHLNLVNKKNQTALDACMQFQPVNPPFRQRLTWSALISAGAQYAIRESHSIQSAEKGSEQEGTNMDPYKDRINTLILVSTLITTVAFTTGFTLPGGTNSSDPGKGMALMLKHVWFTIFIFCNAISLYGSIIVTIILIWAQLGDLTLALRAIKVTGLLLGVTLATLSVAFLAGVHLVISDLSGLATAFLVLCVIFIFALLLIYILLWLPSESTKPLARYITYYPFRFLIWLVEDETEGKQGATYRELTDPDQISYYGLITDKTK